jgi:hypothetical protein
LPVRREGAPSHEFTSTLDDATKQIKPWRLFG